MPNTLLRVSEDGRLPPPSEWVGHWYCCKHHLLVPTPSRYTYSIDNPIPARLVMMMMIMMIINNDPWWCSMMMINEHTSVDSNVSVSEIIFSCWTNDKIAISVWINEASFYIIIHYHHHLKFHIEMDDYEDWRSWWEEWMKRMSTSVNFFLLIIFTA